MDNYKAADAKIRALRLSELLALDSFAVPPHHGGLFDSILLGTERTEAGAKKVSVLAPGVTHCSRYLSLAESVQLAATTLLRHINPPNQSNLSRLDPSGDYVDLFRRQLPAWTRLRWVTQGHQYEWTARTFDGEVPLPVIFKELAQDVVALVEAEGSLGGWTGSYCPDTSIVNLYREKDRLRGHVDDVEEDAEAPLVTVSLGQSGEVLVVN
ncbi:MAG: uncharacterized protein KVP18_003553 [Porospora cf. gigantea A]|uniref:uncharacterized protein n=1 Tax=Porospora cf. gigantea A TaxID=2853593 RepID=UPI00355A5189|nr:MAG: hypothetical protein KVP18_003553 [Porospora cf. gigantea A]